MRRRDRAPRPSSPPAGLEGGGPARAALARSPQGPTARRAPAMPGQRRKPRPVLLPAAPLIGRRPHALTSFPSSPREAACSLPRRQGRARSASSGRSGTTFPIVTSQAFVLLPPTAAHERGVSGRARARRKGLLLILWTHVGRRDRAAARPPASQRLPGPAETLTGKARDQGGPTTPCTPEACSAAGVNEKGRTRAERTTAAGLGLGSGEGKPSCPPRPVCGVERCFAKSSLVFLRVQALSSPAASVSPSVNLDTASASGDNGRRAGGRFAELGAPGAWGRPCGQDAGSA